MGSPDAVSTNTAYLGDDGTLVDADSHGLVRNADDRRLTSDGDVPELAPIVAFGNVGDEVVRVAHVDERWLKRVVIVGGDEQHALRGTALPCPAGQPGEKTVQRRVRVVGVEYVVQFFMERSLALPAETYCETRARSYPSGMA
jgi:hypothetical protein